MQPDMTTMILSIGLVLAATVFDLRKRRIPNALTYSAVLVAFAYPALRGEFSRLLPAALGLLLGFGLLLLPWLAGGMGAGDVKLMAALGAFLGPGLVWKVFFLSLIAGGFVAVFYLILRSDLREGIRNTGRLIVGLLRDKKLPASESTGGGWKSKGKIPYGVAIAIGTVSTLVPLLR